MEIWKEIKGFDDYKVSNFGRIQSLNFNKIKILKQTLNSHGYFSVTLSGKGKQFTRKVHQLVAVAFLGHTPCGHNLVVDHINRNKQNNNVNNLRIVTQRENSCNRNIKGSSKFIGVYWHKHSGKWMSRIRINGKLTYLGIFTNEREASKAYQEKVKEVSNG
jgi:hypothetical protein